MRLLPVLDLLRGQVVRAVAGRRHEYAAWRSPLAPDADPLGLADRLRDEYRRDALYVADLDALTGAPPQDELLDRLARRGLRLWIDAAVATPERCQEFGRLVASWPTPPILILPLERLASPDDLVRLVRLAAVPELAFSLDLFDGRPWTAAPAWQNLGPLEIAELAYRAGLRRLVVLDVHRVGTGGGPGTTELCRQLRSARADWRLAAGGGVHTADDLRQLADAGCDDVLVASALHDGRLTALEVLQNDW